jgi:hypothetical protein
MWFIMTYVLLNRQIHTIWYYYVISVYHNIYIQSCTCFEFTELIIRNCVCWSEEQLILVKVNDFNNILTSA